jgi:hypothetical protein
MNGDLSAATMCNFYGWGKHLALFIDFTASEHALRIRMDGKTDPRKFPPCMFPRLVSEESNITHAPQIAIRVGHGVPSFFHSFILL